ncbi:hypothetical protein [Deinococcus aquaticus]|uniref:Uncharacterized protein n=1 Tax=Deinococcus aquaticus TaxID=328692 RepID=A0ABY7V8W9_9DEIO|nr:hypothetical protein [Deinococcus aquaticus]WDA60806.1 hypothetical protein M8445_18045 [Deinococcus aquaticus]
MLKTDQVHSLIEDKGASVALSEIADPFYFGKLEASSILPFDIDELFAICSEYSNKCYITRKELIDTQILRIKYILDYDIALKNIKNDDIITEAGLDEKSDEILQAINERSGLISKYLESVRAVFFKYNTPLNIDDRIVNLSDLLESSTESLRGYYLSLITGLYEIFKIDIAKEMIEKIKNESISIEEVIINIERLKYEYKKITQHQRQRVITILSEQRIVGKVITFTFNISSTYPDLNGRVLDYALVAVHKPSFDDATGSDRNLQKGRFLNIKGTLTAPSRKFYGRDIPVKIMIDRIDTVIDGVNFRRDPYLLNSGTFGNWILEINNPAGSDVGTSIDLAGSDSFGLTVNHAKLFLRIVV